MENKPQFHPAPDFIRTVAILLVVLLHTSTNYPMLYGEIDSIWVQIGNIISVPTRTAVPLFFIISGWLLLQKERESYGVFFKKRFLRLIPPFLFYLSFYYLWQIMYQGKQFTIRVILSEILNGRLYVHFWFVYAIIGLYLLVPVLRDLVHHGKRETQLYILALWVLSVSILPLLDNVFGLEINPPNVFYLTGYIGFFLTGYVLRDVTLNKKQMTWVLGILLLCFALMAGLTAWLSAYHGTFFNYFYGYLNPLNVAASAAMFLLLKSIPFVSLYARFPRLQNRIKFLSAISYGVYLIHPLFILMVERGLLGFKVTAQRTAPWVGIPLLFGVSLALSVVLVAILRKIPGLKYFAT